MSDRMKLIAYMRDNPLALDVEYARSMMMTIRTTDDHDEDYYSRDYHIIEAARLKRQKVSGGIGVLPLYGIIDQKDSPMLRCWGGTSTEQFGADFDAMHNNPEVGATLVDCDSPGGSVFGVQELCQRMADRDRSKPVVAVVNPMCASACYWLAAQCDQVFITPSGQAGSIGVWTAHLDESKALEDAGLSVTFVSAGKHKVEGNSTEPLSDEAKEAMQAEVDSYYDSFVKAVASGRSIALDRKVTPKEVAGGFGQGRMLVAAEAVTAGLADNIATLPEVIDSFRSAQSKRQAAADTLAEAAKALGRRAHQIREAQISQLTRRSE